MDNGTIQVSWRLGVVVALLGSMIGGAFWAGRFTDRVDNMDRSITSLKTFSQTMGVKVDVLRQLEAADAVGDAAVEKQLEQIQRVLVRIETLLRARVRDHNELDRSAQ